VYENLNADVSFVPVTAKLLLNTTPVSKKSSTSFSGATQGDVPGFPCFPLASQSKISNADSTSIFGSYFGPQLSSRA
jgi:hypothetical protein